MPRSALALARLIPAPDQAPADAPLMRAFLSADSAGSEAAFTNLVRRHGPMVLAVCRRVLGNPHDADDAFQATFLVLARKAGTIRSNLAGWLYAVAVRTARGVRVMRDRRRKHELLASPEHKRGKHSLPDHDLAAVIDEELSKLPDYYREAIVLCELRGVSRKEAAAELGIPEGTLSSRLAGAKRKLAALLSARGLAAPAVLVPFVAPVAVSAALVQSAVSASRGLAGTVASAAAGAVMKGMLFDQLKSVALAVGVLLTVVCGGWAMTGAPGGSDPAGSDPAIAPVPRLTTDPAAKLVAQLGAEEFADREAAQNELRKLGSKAESALKAVLKSESPEIRDRAAKVLNEIRKDQLWDVFARVAGDDKVARELFTHITSSPRAMAALKAALDNPTQTDELYRTRTTELLRIAGGHPPVDAEGKASVPTTPGDVRAVPTPSLGDVAGWLFLGSLQSGKAMWREVTHEGWEDRLSSHVPFLPEDDYTSAKPIAAAYQGELSRPLKKLTAAWLAKRRENDMLRAGFALAIRYDIADAVAAARIMLKEPKPTDIRPWNLAAVAIFIALHGGKDDLPLLARHATDDRSFGSWLNLPPGTDLTFTPPLKEGRDLFCNVRDAVVVSMCKLAGKDTADFGFPPFPATKHPNGQPMSLSSATTVGFSAKADRAKAFEKAAEWLKSFETKEEPKADPVAAKLVVQLGATEFADREAAQKALRELGMKAQPALRAGLRSDNPEVRRGAIS